MSSAGTSPALPEGLPASEAYRSQAGHYDRRTDAFRQWRELLVASLPVRPRDTVLDVGCGTGLCAPLLHRKVGPTGAMSPRLARGELLSRLMQLLARQRPAPEPLGG